MNKAYNQLGKLIDVVESNKCDTYRCPICKELLTRNFGLQRQYFSHPEGKGDNCELKIKLLEKNGEKEFTSSETNILHDEYYYNKFDNVHIELSDYKSEEGYFLTKEQKDIIFSKEDRIKISALAGSAKSSTLYYYAKERPFKKILYIVYNKSMKDEAEKSFGRLSNVDIKTMHGLAYGYVGRFYKNKLSFNYGAVDIIKDLNLDWKRDMELAVQVNKMISEYMLSNVKEFEEIELYKDANGNETPERVTIINTCKRLWELKKKYNNSVKIEHDFYLKLFQLSKTNLSDKYDIILLDEAQDSNLMMLDIILNSKVKGIVIVGDKFQQLYAWRKAINIMPHFKGKEYKLTTSFRVSQNIANIANLIVKDVTTEDISMKGFNVKQTIVDEIDKNKPYACLCRTNSYIFSEVFDILRINTRAKLFFEGGYNSYNFQNVKDAYFFYLGYEVKNNLFNKFKDYAQMREYAESVEDLELLSLDRMVSKYGSDIPKIIDSIKNNSITEKERADVIFSTIHRSKGMTYNMPVYISDDHFDIEKAFRKAYVNVDPKENFDIKAYYEEMCIIYVAITRCAREIELSEKLKNYLLLRYKFFKNTLTK
jgi:superfamily I DNA/RNA helicase